MFVKLQIFIKQKLNKQLKYQKYFFVFNNKKLSMGTCNKNTIKNTLISLHFYTKNTAN